MAAFGCVLSQSSEIQVELLHVYQRHLFQKLHRFSVYLYSYFVSLARNEYRITERYPHCSKNVRERTRDKCGMPVRIPNYSSSHRVACFKVTT